MECVCESCARKDCNERTKQDDLRIVIQCADFIQKNMTNGDLIRAMGDEELARWICNQYSECTCLGAHLCLYGDGKANGMVKWLKQPVEDE